MPDTERVTPTEAPERIWLQPTTVPYDRGGEWTWCWHEIGEGDIPDVEYVRADRAPVGATREEPCHNCTPEEREHGNCPCVQREVGKWLESLTSATGGEIDHERDREVAIKWARYVVEQHPLALNSNSTAQSIARVVLAALRSSPPPASGKASNPWRKLAAEACRFLNREQIEQASKAAGWSSTFCAGEPMGIPTAPSGWKPAASLAAPIPVLTAEQAKMCYEAVARWFRDGPDRDVILAKLRALASPALTTEEQP
ncbi:MAG: hypothetical protein WEA80_01740 [Gemmatimonadaceae bacterium]